MTQAANQLHNATLDRAKLGVEVHQRAMNRVVILHDEGTDRRQAAIRAFGSRKAPKQPSLTYRSGLDSSRS